MYIIKDTEINFIWKSEDIINKITEFSAIYTQNGTENEFERFSLSPENIAFFEIMINKHLTDLSSIFIKCSDFKQDSLFTGENIENVMSLGFTIYQNLDHEGKILYDINRIMLLEKNSEEYLVTSILLDWAKVNELTKLIKILETLQEQIIDHARNNLFHTRAPAYKKSYSCI